MSKINKFNFAREIVRAIIEAHQYLHDHAAQLLPTPAAVVPPHEAGLTMRSRSLERFASSPQRTRVARPAHRAWAIRPLNCAARIGADEDWEIDEDLFEDADLPGDELAELILESAAIMSDPARSEEFLNWLTDPTDEPDVADAPDEDPGPKGS